MKSCWFARFTDTPCDGPMDRCHLIPKQNLKREVSKDPRVVWHSLVWVWGCRHHHANFDNNRIKVSRGELPPGLAAYAETFGIGWLLDRLFPPTE